MAEKHDGTISAGRRRARIAVAVMMVILTLADFALMCFCGRHSEADYLKLMTGVVGLLFAATLYVACCYRNQESTRQGNTFVMVSVLLFLTIFLSAVFDAIEGTPELGNLSFALLTVTSVIATFVNFLFWSYQCASMPENRAQRGCTHAIYCASSGYIVLLVINIFTRFMYDVDASDMVIYTPAGTMIEFVFTSAFYLTYLFYILPQHCSAKKSSLLPASRSFRSSGFCWRLYGPCSGSKSSCSLPHISLCCWQHTSCFSAISQQVRSFCLHKKWNWQNRSAHRRNCRQR